MAVSPFGFDSEDSAASAGVAVSPGPQGSAVAAGMTVHPFGAGGDSLIDSSENDMSEKDISSKDRTIRSRDLIETWMLNRQ